MAANNRISIIESKSFKVHRVLHAGYLFDSGRAKILFDPVLTNPFSVNCYAFPEVSFSVDKIKNLNVDAIFISHIHDDHLCFKSLNLLSKQTPIFIYAKNLAYVEMLQLLGFTSVTLLEINKSVYISNHIKITPYEALDSEIDSLYHIEINNFNVLNVVDSWIDPTALDKLALIKNWDLVLWPFQTLRELQVLTPQKDEVQPELPHEWLEQIKKLNPTYIVPSSCQFKHEEWSWYNYHLFPITYKFFESWIKNNTQNIEILRLEPSSGYQITKLSNKQLNLEKLPDLEILNITSSTLQDYNFNPKVSSLSFADIISKFKPLNTTQKKQLLHFLESEILMRLKSAFEDLQLFHKNNMLWQLVIHDHFFVKVLNFKFYDTVIEQIDQTHVDQVHWKTEILSVKLWSALFEGESLTSSYLRINDFNSHLKSSKQKDFEETPKLLVESELDVLEDPLIKVVFNINYLKFHMNQLKQSMQNYKLIKANFSHSYQIADLVNSAYRGDISKIGWTTEAELLDGQRTDFEAINEIIAHPNEEIFILQQQESEKIFGCVLFKKFTEQNELKGYLGMLTVSPFLQGHGYGKVLVQKVEERAQELKCSLIKMTVISKRTELIQWYEKQGYFKNGEIENFPYGNDRFGIPKRNDLEFVVLTKKL